MKKTRTLALARARAAPFIAAALYAALAVSVALGTRHAWLRIAEASVLALCPVALLWAFRGATRPDEELWAANATLRVAALGHKEDARRIRLYRRLVEEAPIGLAVVGLEEAAEPGSLRIIEMNPAGVRLSAAGRSPAGRRLAEFAPEAAATDLPAACVRAIRSGRGSLLPDFISSERVPGAHFSIRIFPLGESLAGLAFENVTAQAAARDALSRSNADLTQFAYVASHDLQEPVRKANAFAGQLRARLSGRLDGVDREMMDRLERSLDGMQSLIDGLLTLARVSADDSPAQTVDLGPVAAEVVDDLHFALAQSGGTVRVDALPAVRANPHQMRQLLLNLLSNAVKFHRPGAAPRVRVYGRPRPDGLAEFSVEDDGVGFDAASAGRLFQPFSRLHSRKDFPGSGMGLAICAKIVARNGGTIGAKAAVGRGALFTVLLPLAPAQDDPKTVGGAAWNRE